MEGGEKSNIFSMCWKKAKSHQVPQPALMYSSRRKEKQRHTQTNHKKEILNAEEIIPNGT